MQHRTQGEVNVTRRGAAILAALSLMLITLAAYWPVTSCGFVWDDDRHVINNTALRSVEGLEHIWWPIGKDLLYPISTQYYPVVYTSLWLDYQAWGLNPTGYHVTNILLHAIAVILLWLVLRHLRMPGAWVAAAVFALHPVHVESVAWITERKNVLSGVLYLGAALAYLRWMFPGGSARPDGEENARPSHWLYALSLVLFAGALLGKSVTCSLPAAILLVVWWKRGRIGWRDVRPLVPFLALGLVLGLLTVWMERARVGAVGQEWDLTLIDRCLIAGRALWFYPAKLVWPQPLIFIYPRWQIDAGAWWQYLYPAAAALVVAGLWLSRNTIGRGPLVAVLFFAGTLVPALGFFNTFPMQFSFVADHFQYLASIGIIVLAVAATATVTARMGEQGQAGAVSLATCVLVVLGLLTWRQGYVYADAKTLWRDTLDKNPRAWIAHANLGFLLLNEGKVDESVSHSRQSLELNPRYDRAHINLAIGLHQLGRIDEAIDHLNEAIDLKPDTAEAHNNLGIFLHMQGRGEEAIESLLEAVRLAPDLYSTQLNLANLLLIDGRAEEAVDHARMALRYRGDLPETHNTLASALLRVGDRDEAIEHLRRAIELRQSYAEAHYNLGVALVEAGRLHEALARFRDAARYRPGWADALNRSAWILATHPDPRVRDPREAIRLAERASELTGGRLPTILDTLAAAYAADGRFDQAVETARRALGIEVDASIRGRLELYERGETYVEPAN